MTLYSQAFLLSWSSLIPSHGAACGCECQYGTVPVEATALQIQANVCKHDCAGSTNTLQCKTIINSVESDYHLRVRGMPVLFKNICAYRRDFHAFDAVRRWMTMNATWVTDVVHVVLRWCWQYLHKGSQISDTKWNQTIYFKTQKLGNDIVYLDLFISVDFLSFALLACSLELCCFPCIPKYTNQIAMVQTDHTPTHLVFFRFLRQNQAPHLNIWNQKKTRCPSWYLPLASPPG